MVFLKHFLSENTLCVEFLSVNQDRHLLVRTYSTFRINWENEKQSHGVTL